MTSDDNVKTLSNELHELADDLAPSSSNARDRARRGIARHSRNRRAALGAGVAVVVIATTTVFAVGRTDRDSQRPLGTTPRVTVPTPPNVVVTSTAPTTAPPGQPTPGSPVLASVPPIGDLTAMPSSYAKTFPWGTGPGEVAFHTPQGEGASGGPVAFSADAAGNIVMLDHSSGRIVRLQNGTDSSNPIAVSPAVTAAVFDSEGRVIVATVGDVAVYLPSGALQHDFSTVSQTPITRLQIVGKYVFSVSDTYQRTALLQDNGTGYSPPEGDFQGGPQPPRQPDPREIEVIVNPDRHVVIMSVSGTGTGTQYEIATADAIRTVDAERVLADGTLVFVLTLDSGVGTDPVPTKYVVGRIDAEGHARYQTVSASAGYLVNGPGFVINDDGLAVMGSTAAGGATVSYYPFN
jgi:hypothetical protein